MQVAAQLIESQCNVLKLTSEIEEEVSALNFNEKPSSYSVIINRLAEHVEIVNAVSLTKGHWFKCPNGSILLHWQMWGCNR